MSTTSNPKRIQLLTTGKDLFWKFGFRRVTIEEISKEAGVSKMTFYKYFPNKIELAKCILDEIFDESLEKIRMISEDHETPEKTFKKILQLKSEGTRGIGEEFIKDLYTNVEIGLKTYMEEKTTLLFTEMIKVYEKGKKDGWIRKDLNIPFFLSYIRKSMDMVVNDELLAHFNTPQDMIMELTNFYLYGITPHE